MEAMKRRKLPIGGIQTFSELRREYDVYVDKTAHIYEMATSYKAVFLARLRRFGKSLLCSTIKSLFKGEKELFDGLYVSTMDWEWKEHPVIHLELAGEDYTINGLEMLAVNLGRQLDKACYEYGVTLEGSASISDKFARVIFALYEKLGSVVVVIDEYDSPLISTIKQPELNEKLREALKGFFGVLKQNDQYLRFVFVTGVTKFSQISLFSGFNQPRDISMDSEFCDVCGITYGEIDKYFSTEIDSFYLRYGGREDYLKKLKEYYDGYCFTEDKIPVFNTYGLLNHFNSNGKFLPFWSMSGHPSLLQKYLETRDVDILDVESA